MKGTANVRIPLGSNRIADPHSVSYYVLSHNIICLQNYVHVHSHLKYNTKVNNLISQVLFLLYWNTVCSVIQCEIFHPDYLLEILQEF